MFFVQAKKLRFSFDEKQRSWKMDTGNFLSLEDPGIGSGLWYFLLFEAFPIPKPFIEAAHSPKPRLFVGTALGKSKRATCIYCQGPGDDCQQNISVNCHPTFFFLNNIRVNGKSGCWRVWTRCAWSSVKASPSLDVKTSSRSLSVSHPSRSDFFYFLQYCQYWHTASSLERYLIHGHGPFPLQTRLLTKGKSPSMWEK